MGKPKNVSTINTCLHKEVPRLMQLLPSETEGTNGPGGNPFADDGEGDAILDPTKKWVVSNAQKKTYDNKFYSLQLKSGKASGGQIRNVMMQSKLPQATLRQFGTCQTLHKMEVWIKMNLHCVCGWLIT